MSVLIIAGPGDMHVWSVRWALEHLGTESWIWHPAPPWAPRSGVKIGPEQGVEGSFGDLSLTSELTRLKSVWMRRWTKAIYPPSFSDGDIKAAGAELGVYHRGVLHALPSDILWANPRTISDYKIRQLIKAQACGLRVPETLVTDSAEEAKRFIGTLRPRQCIYKPFHSFYWESEGGLDYTVTSIVTPDDLDIPEQLIWSPGIFQEFIPKACELRVCVFGQTCVAARIFDQDPIDWRTRQFDMSVEPYVLPAEVEDKILRFMRAMGLHMGMIDLIVTTDGDYVFLEVNEQGQFLWVELKCPELPLLEICSRFLASGDPLFRWDGQALPDLAVAGYEHTDSFRQYEREREHFREAGGTHSNMLIPATPQNKTEKV